MRFRFLFLLILFSSLNVFRGQVLKIGLFPNQSFSKVKFANATGTYHLIADTSYIGLIDHYSSCEIRKANSGKVELSFNGNRFSNLNKIKILATQNEKSIEFSGLAPVLKSRAFEGDFQIQQSDGKLLILNLVDIETYLEGVVESEAGTGQKFEYYKVQAIISRTFAYKALSKHAKEGFNLCNQVHCQAYLHKRNGDSKLDSAVYSTKGMVLLKVDSTFAPTFFSANCGGQTCKPEQVWNESISGLDSFKDTFCIYTKQAKWSKQIPLSEWKQFLVEKYQFPVDDSLSYAMMLNWSTDFRPSFLFHPGYGIPMRDIREHFNLKSAFFNVSFSNNMIILNGKGYGHGVGLCQEGAMKMARLNYTFDQILNFYYPSFSLGTIAPYL